MCRQSQHLQYYTLGPMFANYNAHWRSFFFSSQWHCGVGRDRPNQVLYLKEVRVSLIFRWSPSRERPDRIHSKYKVILKLAKSNFKTSIMVENKLEKFEKLIPLDASILIFQSLFELIKQGKKSQE